jgi:hypothetical protein
MSARGFLDDFHNIGFKIKYKFYIASGPPSQRKFPGAPMTIFDQILSANVKPKVLWKNPIRYDVAPGFSAPTYLIINVSTNTAHNEKLKVTRGLRVTKVSEHFLTCGIMEFAGKFKRTLRNAPR